MMINQTFIAGAVVGLGGLLVFASWITLFYIYVKNNQFDWQVYPILVALIAGLVLNQANL
jgi:hypothetical protein